MFLIAFKELKMIEYFLKAGEYKPPIPGPPPDLWYRYEVFVAFRDVIMEKMDPNILLAEAVKVREDLTRAVKVIDKQIEVLKTKAGRT